MLVHTLVRYIAHNSNAAAFPAGIIEVSRFFFFFASECTFYICSKFQPFATCVLTVLLIYFFLFFFSFFIIQAALQVMQCNSHAKMSSVCSGKEAACNSASIQAALDNILLFFDFCFCHREPDFNESSEGDDISSKVICNVCLYRCVILMCTGLVDAVTC